MTGRNVNSNQTNDPYNYAVDYYSCEQACPGPKFLGLNVTSVTCCQSDNCNNVEPTGSSASYSF